MSLFILNPGLLTTVQDMGRVGYQRYGVSSSGAVDALSAALANILVGNDQNEAVLECTLLGPQVRFDHDACIAVTGGDLSPCLDNEPLEMYQATLVKAGQVLKFGPLKTGCRAYVAIAGGMDIPQVMGSRSTHLRSGIGGFHGQKLEKGFTIDLRAPESRPRNFTRRTTELRFVPRDEYTLRVVLGPQEDAFTRLGIAYFFGSQFTVTPEFDRMGCRLSGPKIEHVSGGDIISDGIAMGAIQVPSSGQPIIMLSDRQTTGGYTKIATVITADHTILGQLKAGDKIRFEPVSIQLAQDALIAQRTALRDLKKQLNAGFLKRLMMMF